MSKSLLTRVQSLAEKAPNAATKTAASIFRSLAGKDSPETKWAFVVGRLKSEPHLAEKLLEVAEALSQLEDEAAGETVPDPVAATV